jgi:flagellar biosynthesis protein FlhF
MKIKRVGAANLREGMQQIREALGPEAVILSNRRVSEGIEIVAAIDYDENLEVPEPPSREALAQKSPPAEGSLRAAEPPPLNPTSVARGQSVAGAPQLAGKRAAIAQQSADAPRRRDASDSCSGGGSTQSRRIGSQEPVLVEMQNELKVMHHLLEQQLAGLAWGELARRQPHRAEILSRLLDFGLSPELCLRLAHAVAAERDPERAQALALETLARGLCTTHDDILTGAGVVALLGPTGVGKTTTVAKLAARYQRCHGPHQVALVTTDSYRIGAFDQLRIFGMILDIPVRLASSHKELQAAIADFADKPLVLIDTAGMSQRDLRLAQQFTLMGAVPQVKHYLVLAANAELATLHEVVTAFAPVQLAGCILTKLDEARRLGSALSVLHEQALPLAYVSAGQGIPEDLQAAQAHTLVRQGMDLIPNLGTEDEVLALTFGRKVVNARG